MKNKILIDATGGSKWVGGLYYKKNVLFSLLQNAFIAEHYTFVVISEAENKAVFSDLLAEITYVEAKRKTPRGKIFELLYYAMKYRCRYVFPCGHQKFSRFGIIPIHWIADFQHNRLPELFSDEERNVRTATYSAYAQDDFPLLLSSHDAQNDFREFYSKTKQNVYVVPFVSDIENMIRQLSPMKETEIMEKYHLFGKPYTCIMNQFWQHKNHIAVLKAMKAYFFAHPESELVFAFTGKLDDYRAPEYIEKLKKLFEEDVIKKHALLLGFIDRIDQIVIMKNAQFVIQPSRFEGWGTVVEDAKVLDKTILLSDIPVHREQKNDKCKLFDPYNPEMLASIIEEEAEKEHKDDFEQGILDMHRRAKEYSKGFEQLLKDQERKKI